MAGISLSVVLEKPGYAFEWGDIVKGHVKVTVEQDCPAAALIAVLYCKGFAESKGFAATVETESVEQDLFKGTWTAGSYDYPFEIVVPQGSFTYKGHIVDVTWHVGARARASGGEDIRTDIEVTVLPAKKASGAIGTKTSGEVIHTETAGSLKGFFAFSSLVILVGLYVSWMNSSFSKRTNEDLFFFGGVLPTVLGLALLFLATRKALMNRRIKKVEVRIGSTTVRAGDRIPCSLTFYAGLPFDVERVWAVLRAEEVVDFRRFSIKRVLQHVLYEASTEFPVAVKRVQVNVPFCMQGDVPVPKDIPCSINPTEGVAVTWRVDFKLEMKKYPDWFHFEDITVVA